MWEESFWGVKVCSVERPAPQRLGELLALLDLLEQVGHARQGCVQGGTPGLRIGFLSRLGVT